MDEKLEQIKSRCGDIAEWTRGRSVSTYKDAKEHASVLAKQYVEDVSYLLQQLRNKIENFVI